MDLSPLLAASSAADAFKADVRRYSLQGEATRIETTRYNPQVKVARLLSQLLHEERSLPIERVRIDARSGCSDFRGTIEVHTAEGPRRFEFNWCCRWRAEQQGWIDYFGFPDQIRAAQEFGWRCFQIWRELPTAPLSAGEVEAQLSLAR